MTSGHEGIVGMCALIAHKDEALEMSKETFEHENTLHPFASEMGNILAKSLA